jgi:hypothetical protein
MNRFFLLLLLGFTFFTASAQKPEPIYSYGRLLKPISYYKEQSVAWKKVIDENPKDAKAWFYYYYTKRNLYYNDTTDKRSNHDRWEEIKQLVDAMGKQVPDSYEYNLCRWMAGGFDMSLLPYLMKANELGEGRTEHYDFMVNIGEIKRDHEQKWKYEKMKYDAGLFSTGLLYYNYNVMMSIPKNGIVIAAGDNDTYPIWALQALGIRKDIMVINTSLILIDEYRDRIFKELGLEKMEIGWNGDSTKLSVKQFNAQIIKHITRNTPFM